ncbi:MAG: LytTR family DNA-binding domain-containing protein [Eubacteriales bacterium]|nr:LytTR family DNA-binding domain-containing protein [Eubacteriales bacterium]
MKLTLTQINEGEEEVRIRYRRMNETVEAIASIVRGTEPKIAALWEGQTIFLPPEKIYYLENVDGVTYAYLEDRVAKVPESLRALEMRFGSRGFFRCSKSMILNLYKIGYLKSEPESRIRATMENGEQVIISRKYAKELRRTLKGGVEDET